MIIYDQVSGAEETAYSIIDGFLDQLINMGPSEQVIHGLNSIYRSRSKSPTLIKYTSAYKDYSQSISELYNQSLKLKDQAKALAQSPNTKALAQTPNAKAKAKAKALAETKQTVNTMLSDTKKSIKLLESVSTQSRALEQELQKLKESRRTEIYNLATEIGEQAEILCPKHSGALVNSMKIELFEYGFCIGFYMPYAAYIHENMEIVHPIHTFKGETYDCEGEAKYLWNALAQAGIEPYVEINPDGSIQAFVKVDFDANVVVFDCVGSKEELMHE